MQNEKEMSKFMFYIISFHSHKCGIRNFGESCLNSSKENAILAFWNSYWGYSELSHSISLVFTPSYLSMLNFSDAT